MKENHLIVQDILRYVIVIQKFTFSDALIARKPIDNARKHHIMQDSHTHHAKFIMQDGTIILPENRIIMPDFAILLQDDTTAC